ncbi:MAG: XRE family transcriptional regulator [Anaerolineaceae bacterium]|nr:XRE family transcriptional regulator [Anaerolineaceae bacterium]
MAIGERIKLARKKNFMSMEDLSARVGVSKMAISKYEKNQDVPGSAVLIRLARALDVSIEYLLRPQRESIQLKAFRKHASLKVKEEEAILAQAQDWLERYLDVDELVVLDKEKTVLPTYEIDSIEQIEACSLDLRQKWNLGEDAIENMIELLEDKNIRVGLIDGVNDFDACTFWFDDEPVMVTKSNIPGDRQRFNLAHELGHLVLKVQEGLDEEKCAHRFAASFLIPAATIKQELGEHRSSIDPNELYLLKHKYGISMQALVYRTKDLGIISEAAALRIFKRFAIEGWRKEEPGKAVASERPQKMHQMIYRGLAEDIISPSRAKELLGEPINLF